VKRPLYLCGVLALGAFLATDVAADAGDLKSAENVPGCEERCFSARCRAGLGWEVYDFGTRRYLFHTGADRGVFTLAWLSPTNGTGTVIPTNGANGAQVMLPILDALVDALGSDREFIDFLRVLAGQ